MAITTNAGFDSAAASAALGVLYLVELQFAAGTTRLTNWPHDVTVGADTYVGVGGLGGVGELRESEDGATQTVELELSQVNASLLAMALGSVSDYQGRPVRIRVALTNADLQLTGSPVLRFSGFMDFLKIRRTDSGDGRIILVCRTGGYDLRRNPAALRMTDAQHQAARPGELGFQYVADLIGRPQQWLSKRFQFN